MATVAGDATSQTGERAPPPLRHAVAVFAGNGLGFYDFVTDAFFAVYIGRTSFPSTDASLSLLGSPGIFGLSPTRFSRRDRSSNRTGGLQ